MRCLKLNKVSVAAYAAHHLSEREAERVEAHLHTCSFCCGLVEDLERNSLALQGLRVEPADDSLRRIRARVLAQISTEGQLPGRSSPWRWVTGRQLAVGWRMLYVAAALVVLSAGTLLFWNTLRHRSTGPLTAQKQPPQTRTQPSVRTPTTIDLPEQPPRKMPAPGSAAVSPRKDRDRPIAVAEAPTAPAPIGAATPEVLGNQDQVPKSSLINQLQNAYPLTVMEADGFGVAKPGTILEIQLDGIQANPMKSPPFQNTFEDGQVVAGGHSTMSKFIPGGLSEKTFAAAPRTLAAKEKVYLLKMDAKDDAVIFTVQTCGTCDPAVIDLTHKPFVASISFKFIRGFLAATDLKRVKDAIGTLLVTSAAATDAQPAADAAQQNTSRNAQQTQAPPPAQAAAPDPPPVKYGDIAPPPPPAPKLKLGLTVDEVIAQIGQPITTATAGDKKTYLFKEWRITFIGGKVTDIDVR
jgi:hypothetical protein